MKFPTSFCCLVMLLALTGQTLAEDWTQFRGPGGLATSDATGLPTTWSSTKNIDWKTELPGLGSSSPIVWKQRIYLTCYTGYGLDGDDPGNMDDLMRHVVCVDRGNGAIVWTKSFEPQLPESKYEGNGARHGYSTSTITTDGERLYVFFGASGVFCFDMEGTELWHASVGDKTTSWGSSNSPLLYKNLVIINASIESRSLIALDKLTGKQVWQADGIRGSWNTPVLVDAPDGKTEMVVCIPQVVFGFDPDTGEELWHCEGIPDRGYVCPSVVASEGIVYAIGGRKNTALAIRAGGRGDVTKSHLLWKASKGSNVSSPVLHEGHLYWFHEASGTVLCLDAKNGNVVFQERLSPRPGLIYSSVTVADGKLYAVSQYNGAYVVAAKPEFELLAHNVFEEDPSRSNASVVVSNGQLLLRSDKYLYCVGKK